MAALSNKLRSLSHGTAGAGIAHWCPGCNRAHQIRTEGSQPVWEFDGNVAAPTCSPSILVREPRPEGEKRCHYFLRAGFIEFCSDSTHALAGQQILLPDWPSEPTE